MCFFRAFSSTHLTLSTVTLLIYHTHTTASLSADYIASSRVQHNGGHFPAPTQWWAGYSIVWLNGRQVTVELQGPAQRWAAEQQGPAQWWAGYSSAGRVQLSGSSIVGRLQLSGRVRLNGGQVLAERQGPAQWWAGYS